MVLRVTNVFDKTGVKKGEGSMTATYVTATRVLGAIALLLLTGEGVHTEAADVATGRGTMAVNRMEIQGNSATPWSVRVPLAPQPKEYFVAVDGKADNSGTEGSPWDLTSVASRKQKIEPGSIVWVRGGRYANPGRISLSGATGMPIHLRASLGERSTIDGGVDVSGSHLWIWDLEFASHAPQWRPTQALGNFSSSAKMPGALGPLNVLSGESPKFINLVIHNNTMGVGFWKGVRNAELHGCLIYDNGFPGTDRPHGPGIYTQNMTGTTRLLTDNIVAGNFSTGMQMYGSKIDKQVNDFLVEGNVFFAPRVEAGSRCYVLCGGEHSKNIVVRNNVFSGYKFKAGALAEQVVVDNIVMHGAFQSPNREKNRILQSGKGIETFIRPNKYDPRRANLIVINWDHTNSVDVDLGAFLKVGDTFRILDSLDFYGKPYVEGKYTGGLVSLAMPNPLPWELRNVPEKECWVYVIMKQS